MEIFFIACLCLALISCTILFLLDLVRKTGLNLSAKERQRIADKAEKLEDSSSVNSNIPGSEVLSRNVCRNLSFLSATELIPWLTMIQPPRMSSVVVVVVVGVRVQIKKWITF